ncbi:MAG: hypothetical protein M0036_20730 [Desulfobacteraceae bacterium]|nr:hypothetical protein [Desulfobacteraceae bacterium]
MLDFYSDPVSGFPKIDDALVGMARYHIMRPYLEDGDVLEWSSHTALGWIIRRFTGQDVNHTGGVIRMRWYEGTAGDRVFTPEANERGMVLTYLSRELRKYKGRVYLLKLKPEMDNFRPKIVRAQLDMIGVPYDFGGLLANAFGRVSIDARRYFCSEGIASSFVEAGAIKIQQKAPRPGEIYRWGFFLPRVRIF